MYSQKGTMAALIISWETVGRQFMCQEFFRIQRYGNCVLAKFLREGGQLIWLKGWMQGIWDALRKVFQFTYCSRKNWFMKLSIDTWDVTNNMESASKTIEWLEPPISEILCQPFLVTKLGNPSLKPKIPHLTGSHVVSLNVTNHGSNHRKVKHASNLAEKICLETQLDQDVRSLFWWWVPSLKLTFSHLKIDVGRWFSFWKGLFSGANC